MSMTRAEGLPAEKLENGLSEESGNGKGRGREEGFHADSTPLRASQKAGVPQFSMAISMGFSLPLPALRGDSVMSSGFSSKGLSCVSIPSISSLLSSVFSLSPLVMGSEGLVFVRREVMAYSHRLVAVSQSSTRPLSEKGFPISILGRGLCMAFSPYECFGWASEERIP